MMNLEEYISILQCSVPVPEMLKQAAEECIEMAHALLKLNRIVEGVNPTPITIEEAVNNVRMEHNDVLLLCKVLELQEDEGLQTVKAKRWKDRLDEMMEANNDESASADAHNNA